MHVPPLPRPTRNLGRVGESVEKKFFFSLSLAFRADLKRDLTDCPI